MKKEKIIQTFDLGGVSWEVVEQSRHDVLGQCDLSKARIVMSSECEDKLKEQTYYHELIHAILYTMGHELYDNEAFIDTFSTFLYQAIKTKVEVQEEKEE